MKLLQEEDPQLLTILLIVMTLMVGLVLQMILIGMEILGVLRPAQAILLFQLLPQMMVMVTVVMEMVEVLVKLIMEIALLIMMLIHIHITQ